MSWFFSVFDHGPVAISQMKELLVQFEQHEDIRVRLEVIGPDVS